MTPSVMANLKNRREGVKERKNEETCRVGNNSNNNYGNIYSDGGHKYEHQWHRKNIVRDFAMSHEYSKAISNENCCFPMAINHWGLINVEKGETQQILTVIRGVISAVWLTIYCTEGSISITAEGKTYDISAGQSITFNSYLAPRETVDVTGAGKGYYRISYCCIEKVYP